jgi:general secretion pathway protein L
LNDALLLFLGADEGFAGWLRLEGGVVSARGPGLDGLPATEGGLPIVAVVPGEAVTLHWIELPAGLAPAQAAAAARLMAAELSAQPIGEMHVAVGREAGGPRCTAIVPAAAMADWLERLAAAGFDPDLMVPEALLLPEPAEAIVRYDRGDMALYRGPALGFATEPELAALLLGEKAAIMLDGDAFEAGLSEALADPEVDLRQGPFARRRQWTLEWGVVRRLALLAAAILFVTLAIQIASILRYTFAADALEAETRRVAAAALPRSPAINDASGDLEARLSELRGGGAGYGAIAATLFDAVRATPNAELSALTFSPDGSMRATVQADTPATLAALSARIEAGGFTVEAGVPRGGGGRQVSDLMVRVR